jgi:hypothetical protein
MKPALRVLAASIAFLLLALPMAEFYRLIDRLFFRRLASASSRIALRISWRSKESGGLTGSRMTGLRFVFVAIGFSSFAALIVTSRPRGR